MPIRRGEVPHTVQNRSSGRTQGFARVLGTSLGAGRGTVLYDLAGVGRDDDAEETRTETRDAQPVHGNGVMFSRPPVEPERDEVAEVVFIRMGDEQIPIAVQDSRPLKWVNAGAAFTLPRAKESLWCGHGGGFASFLRRETANGPEDDLMIRLPYDRDATGAPTKSDVITAGQGSDGVRAIDIRMGTGLAVTLRDGKATVSAPNGSVSFTVSNDGLNLLGTTNIFGGVTLGGQLAVELAKHAILVQALNAMKLAVTAIGSGAGAPGNPSLPLLPAVQTALNAMDAAIAVFTSTGKTINVKGQ